MCNAVVPCEHPKVTLPISMDIIAESQHFIVVFHFVAIHVNSGESLHTTAPKHMARWIFHQSVIGSEIIPIIIEQPDFGMIYVSRIVDALDAVFPRTYP